jgi:hypothetical protein
VVMPGAGNVSLDSHTHEGRRGEPVGQQSPVTPRRVGRPTGGRIAPKDFTLDPEYRGSSRSEHAGVGSSSTCRI